MNMIPVEVTPAHAAVQWDSPVNNPIALALSDALGLRMAVYCFDVLVQKGLTVEQLAQIPFLYPVVDGKHYSGKVLPPSVTLAVLRGKIEPMKFEVYDYLHDFYVTPYTFDEVKRLLK